MCLFLPSLSFVKILGFNSLFFVQIGLEVNIYLVANSLEEIKHFRYKHYRTTPVINESFPLPVSIHFSGHLFSSFSVV